MGGGKNFGATHLTQAMYRVHANDWNVGQAAGSLAAAAVAQSAAPRDLLADQTQLRAVQFNLVAKRGGPVFWWRDGTRAGIDPSEDCSADGDRALYVAAQMAGVMGVVPVLPGEEISFRAADALSAGEAAVWVQNALAAAGAPFADTQGHIFFFSLCQFVRSY